MAAWFPAFAGMALFTISPLLAASSPEDLLKEAQVQETSTRDLERASQLYEQYLKQPATSRAGQATAYLRLGICRIKTGNREQAKTAWKKIIQDYSDQSEAYTEALNQLQKVQAIENAEIKASTPVVRVVYETPPARWMVEFPRSLFPHTIDGKGRLTSTAAGISLVLTHFPQPHLGVAMEVGSLGSYRPSTVSRDIGLFGISARGEKSVTSVVTLYAQGGPGLYWSKFSNEVKSETKTNIGCALGAGVVIGMRRGFTFNFGYLFHLLAQSTPSEDFVDSIPESDRPANAEILQNRGLRLAGGPQIALSFRW